MDFALVFPFSKIEKFLSFESGGKKVFLLICRHFGCKGSKYWLDKAIS